MLFVKDVTISEDIAVKMLWRHILFCKTMVAANITL